MKPKPVQQPVPKPSVKDMRPRRWQRPPVEVKQRRNKATGDPYVELVNAQPAPKPWKWGRDETN